MRIATIILIYKDGEKEDLKNWRPISLLNADYKALTKVLSTRLRKVIHAIIKPDQTCGIPGRSIHENIIFTQDCIIYANKENKPLAIVSADMSKAFDRVNRSFVDKILEKMGFGNDYRKWFNTVYRDTLSQVLINGFISNRFLLTRGVRQGCPLSPLLFIISVEPLLECIRKNDAIKGFKLPSGRSCSKVKGYADDANYYLHDIVSVEVLLEVIEDFCQASEAKLNRDKTKLLLVGSLKGAQTNQIGVKILLNKIKVLGIWTGSENCDKDNWDPIVLKIMNTFKVWKMRNLTIYGRACITQILALSKLWYVGSVITPPKEIIETIEKEITSFLWRGKQHLINREIVRLPKNDGGLGIANIEEKCRVLKIKWLKEISDSRHENKKDWVEMGNHFIMNYSPKIYDFSILLLTSYHRRASKDIPIFYSEMIETWQKINFKRRRPSIFAFKKMYIWYNDTFVKTAEHDIDLMQLGIYRVQDLWDDDKNEIMNTQGFQGKFCANILRQDKVIRLTIRFNQVRDGIRGFLNDIDLETAENEGKLKIEDYFILEKNSLDTKTLYWKLRKKNSYVGYRIRKRIGFAYSDNFFHKFYVTLNTADIPNKTKSLSWLISWEGIIVGQIAKNWFVEEDGICKICKNFEESISHLFIDCIQVRLFWIWMFQNLEFQGVMDGLTMYLSNYTNVDNCQFYCIAIGKEAIWSFRNKCVFDDLMPSLNGLKSIFREILKKNLNTLLKVYINKGKLDSFLIEYSRHGLHFTEMQTTIGWN